VKIDIPITCLNWKLTKDLIQPEMIVSCSADGIIYDWEILPQDVNKITTDEERKEVR